ncbi:MAG: hypothetical protein WDZ66_02845 [Steroidobacteraceae bacterium]
MDGLRVVLDESDLDANWPPMPDGARALSRNDFRCAVDLHVRTEALDKAVPQTVHALEIFDTRVRAVGNNLCGPGRPDIRDGLQFFHRRRIDVDAKRALLATPDALVSINVPSDKARAVVDAMEREKC